MVDEQKIANLIAAIEAAGPDEASARYCEAIDALSEDSESFLAFAEAMVNSGLLDQTNPKRDRHVEQLGRLIALIDLARKSGGGQG